MAFNELRLEASNLINSGGGVIFLLAGLGILALGRGSRRGRLVGAFATLWGLSRGIEAILGFGEPERAVQVFLDTATFIVLVMLIAYTAAPLDRTLRHRFLAIVAATGLGVAFFAFGTGQRLVDDWGFNPVQNFLGSALLPGSLVVLLAACALRPVGGADPGHEGRGWLLLGLSSGLNASFFTALSGARPTSTLTHGVIALNISGLVLGCVLSVVLYCVLTGRTTPDQRAARWAFLALLLTSLAACAMVLFSSMLPPGEFGILGITRTIGVVLLVIAVAKYDLLGVPLPRLAVRRSVVAGTALGMLFIVAQVAQNFLSAKYGLLMGGIIAGAVLFAANPIQKAIEQRGPRPAATAVRGEESYRKALRIALRDRKLTREEETALHELAHDLGISGPRAHALLAEAENERKGAR